MTGVIVSEHRRSALIIGIQTHNNLAKATSPRFYSDSDEVVYARGAEQCKDTDNRLKEHDVAHGSSMSLPRESLHSLEPQTAGPQILPSGGNVNGTLLHVNLCEFSTSPWSVRPSRQDAITEKMANIVAQN